MNSDEQSEAVGGMVSSPYQSPNNTYSFAHCSGACNVARHTAHFHRPTRWPYQKAPFSPSIPIVFTSQRYRLRCVEVSVLNFITHVFLSQTPISQIFNEVWGGAFGCKFRLQSCRALVGMPMLTLLYNNVYGFFQSLRHLSLAIIKRRQYPVSTLCP